MTDPTTPPAGWYPDTNSPGQERYWDGTAWTMQLRPAVPAAAAVTVAEPVATFSAKKKKRKWPWIVGAAAAVILLFGIIGSLNGGGDDDAVADKKPAAVADKVEPAEPVEEVDTRVEIPDVTGKTVAEAVAALAAVNITLTLPAEVGQDWIVSSQTVPGGTKIEPGDEFSISAAAPAPVYTLAQQNVIKKAQSYLRFSGFSRAGLIHQLEYEGFSTEDSTFGADNAGADWNAEAAEKAKSYLEFSAFSRDGLYEQMAYEEFTDAEILFALAAVGY